MSAAMKSCRARVHTLAAHYPRMMSAATASTGPDDSWGPLHPRVRAARPGDVGRILQLIGELAAYEQAADQVRSTEAQLHDALFGPDRGVYALVATALPQVGPMSDLTRSAGDVQAPTADDDAEVVGFALWFRNFSTWTGSYGIYLEDLYVVPAHRGSGLGAALLRSLATIAVRNGYPRFEWSVLDWNTVAIDFYRALGAQAMSDWTVQRLTGAALVSAALPGTA